MPTGGLKAFCSVFGKGKIGRAVDRDLVVVVEDDELAETEVSGEHVFVPDPDGTAEDDGWLLSAVYDSRHDTSEVVVLDARDVAAGPIARVRIPQRMPFGFHANWFAAEA